MKSLEQLKQEAKMRVFDSLIQLKKLDRDTFRLIADLRHDLVEGEM